MFDELVGTVRELPRDDLKHFGELEVAGIVDFHDFDDARILAVDHNALNGFEREDLGCERGGTLATLHEVTLLGLQEFEVTIDADGDTVTTDEFLGYFEGVHNTVYGLM